MSAIEGRQLIPKSFSEIKTDSPRVAGVEFGTLPESIDSKEIFAGTVTALLDLRQFVEDELESNPDLTPEIKKEIEQAGATVYTFFTTLIGIDPIGKKPTEFNPRSVNVTLAQVPENVFQAWHYLCRTVPQAQECLCADPKKRSTSDSFPEQYGLPYVMVQRALRALAAGNQSILPKNSAAERVYSLLDAKNLSVSSTIDRSKPFPVKPEDITPDRIRLASANLAELLEERRENLSPEVQNDLTLVSSFLRVSSASNSSKERLLNSSLADDERHYYENLDALMADSNRLNLTIIPNSIIEAVARLSLADHSIHLALLGHNVRNIGSVLDASGNRVSTLDRPYAYHPVTVAAHHTIERDKLGLATIHELYKLDDVLSAGNHSGAVEVVSAAQYAKLAVEMGDAAPKELGFLGKTWKFLTTPISELRERRRNRDRERRDNAQVIIWIDQIIGTDPETLGGKMPLLQSGAPSPLRTILTSLEQEPRLQTRPIMEALINLVEWAATSTSPEYGRRVLNALGAKHIPGKIILERINGIMDDIRNINKHLEFFRIFKTDKTPNDVIIDERGWIRLLVYMKEMLKRPELIVDTVAMGCYSAIEFLNSNNPDFPKSNKTINNIAVQIRNSDPVEAIHRLCQFTSFGCYLEKLNPEFPTVEGEAYYTKTTGPVDDIQTLLKDFSTFFHTPEALHDIQASLIKYAAIHGGKEFGEELEKRLEAEKKLDAKTLDKHVEFVKINLEWIAGFHNLADRPESMYDECWDDFYRLGQDIGVRAGQIMVSATIRGLLEEKVYAWSSELLGHHFGVGLQHHLKTASTIQDCIRLAISDIKKIQQLATDTAREMVEAVCSLAGDSEDFYHFLVKNPPVQPSSEEPHLPRLDAELLGKCLNPNNVNMPAYIDSRSEIISPYLHHELMGKLKKTHEAYEKYTGKNEIYFSLGMERCIEVEWKLVGLAKRIMRYASFGKLRKLLSRFRLGHYLQDDFDDLIAEFTYRDSPRTIHARSEPNFRYDRESILLPYHDKNFVPALRALNPNERTRLLVLIYNMYVESHAD